MPIGTIPTLLLSFVAGILRASMTVECKLALVPRLRIEIMFLAVNYAFHALFSHISADKCKSTDSLRLALACSLVI